MIKIFTNRFKVTKEKFPFIKKLNFFTLAIVLNIVVAFYINFISDENNLALFISDILKVSTLIIAAQQFYLSQNDYRTSNQHLEKKEAAVQARYYEEIIMPLMSKMTQNYEHENLKDLNKNFINAEIYSFSRNECEGILQKGGMSLEEYNKSYHKIIQKPSFLKSYAQNLYDIDSSDINKKNLDLIILYELSEVKKTSDSGESNKLFDIKFEELFQDKAQKLILKKIKPSQIKDLKKEDIEIMSSNIKDSISDMLNDEINSAILLLVKSYHNNISNILNKLEYFSMNFNSGIADEGIVYQSLHQTFRSTVENLYYYIILQNKDSTSKYYTHIIDLYSKWNTRYLETKINEDKIKSEHSKKEDNLTYVYTKKERI